VFPVVDFVMRIRGRALLANATVSGEHDVKIGNEIFKDLVDAVGLGAEDQEIPLVWVLDEPAYERFKKAGQLKFEADGALASGPSARHALGRRLAQYKMLVAVPPASRTAERGNAADPPLPAGDDVGDARKA
jgi:hypothetical protein